MEGLRLAGSADVAAACGLAVVVVAALAAALRPHEAPVFSAAAIGHNVLSGVCVAALVGFVLPRLVGQPQATPVALLGRTAGSICMAGLFAGLVVSGLNLAPVVGRLVASSAGAQAYVLGVLALRSLAESPLKQPLAINLPPAAFPGLTVTLGFVLFAWAWSKAFELAAAGAARHAGESAAALRLAALVLGWLGGLVSLLMYGAYAHLAAAGLALRAAL